MPSIVDSKPPLTKPASRAAAVFCSADALAMPAAEVGIAGIDLPPPGVPKPKPAPPTCAGNVATFCQVCTDAVRTKQRGLSSTYCEHASEDF